VKTRKPGRRTSQSKRRSFFSSPEPIRSTKRRSRALRVEQLEDRRVLATYAWNDAAGTLAIDLATGEDVTVSEAAGTTSFTLSAGTFTQTGVDTATGDGTATISFAAGDDISTSISIDNTGAAAGSNDVTFAGGTIISTTITVNANQGGTTSAINFSTGTTTFGGTVNLFASGAGITDSGAGAVNTDTFTSFLSLSAVGQPITLDNPANDFEGDFDDAVSVIASSSVSIDDADSIAFGALNSTGAVDIDSGPSDAGFFLDVAVTFSDLVSVGSLDVDTNANGGVGGIIDGHPFFVPDNPVLVITGTTTLDAGIFDISLDAATNDFGGPVNITSAFSALFFDQDDITFGTVTMTGLGNFLAAQTAGAATFTGLTVAQFLFVDTNGNGGTGGAITDIGLGQLAVSGSSEFDTGTNAAANITLDNPANDLGSSLITTSIAEQSLVDVNGLTDLSLTAGLASAITLISGGALTDADASVDITADRTRIQSVGGMGTGIAAGAAIQTDVNQVDAHNTGIGSMFIRNLGALTLTDLGGSAGSVNGVGGGGEIRATSPLVIAADATTSGGMTYSADDSAGVGDDITLNALVDVSDTTNGLIFNVGDNLEMDPTSTITAATIVTINLDATGGGVPDPGVGSITILDGSVTSTGGTTAVNGFTDNDSLTIQSATNTVENLGSSLTFSGGGGIDTLNVIDSGDATGDGTLALPVDISNGGAGIGTISRLIDANLARTIGFSGFAVGSIVNLQTGNIGADVVEVTPNANVIFNLDGNLPGPLPPGDILVYDGNGTKNLNGAAPGAGQITGVGVQPVNFVEFEEVRSTAGFFLDDTIVLPADGAPSSLRLDRDASGLFLQIWFDNNTGTPGDEVLISTELYASVDAINVIGSADDETLIVDNSLHLINRLIGFDGAGNSAVGAEASGPPGDTLVVRGAPLGPIAARTTYVVANDQDAGTWVIDPDGVVATGDEMVVQFDNLEPVDDDTPSALMDVIYDPGDTDNIRVENGGLLNGVPSIQVTDVGGTFETFRFANKTTVRLHLNDGSDVADVNYTINAAGLATLEIYGHGAIGVPVVAEDNGLDRFSLRATAAPTTSVFGQGGSDLFDNIGIAGAAPAANTLDGLTGIVNIDGGAGANDVARLQDFADATADVVAITSTQITGASPATINYTALDKLLFEGTAGADAINVTSTIAGTSYYVTGNGGGDTVTIGNQSADFSVNPNGSLASDGGSVAAIDGDIMVTGEFNPAASAVDTLNIDASADAALAGAASLGINAVVLYDLGPFYGIDTGPATELLNFASAPIRYRHTDSSFLFPGTNAMEFVNIFASDGADTIAVNATTASNTTRIDMHDGSDFNTMTINGDALSAANIFHGSAGNDQFILNITAHIGDTGFFPTTSLEIWGDANAPGPASTNRDRLIVNDNNAGFVRDLNYDYLDTPGDLDILANSVGNGLFGPEGAGSIPVNIRTMETLRFNSTAANDLVTVTGTTFDDDLTVALAPTVAGETVAASSAFVFLNGNPYDIAPPDSLAANLPGIAGGGTGVDMLLNGVDAATGITLDGAGSVGPADGNRAIVQAASELALIDPAGADTFDLGLGATVLVPGFGIGNAYDAIAVNGAGGVDPDIGIVGSLPDQVVVNNISAGLLVPVTVVAPSFINGILPTSRAGLIVNGGDEAVARANGIADNFFVNTHPLFNIGINGNLPPLGPLAPDGFPAGDQMNLFSPTSFSIWSDKAVPPNVTIFAGNGPFGIIDSSIERTRLFPGNGIVNLIGDDNDATVDQTDNFVVTGIDIDPGGSLDAGVQEMAVVINGSAPILIDNVQRLNVYGYDLNGQDLNNPDPNAPDVPATGATADDIDTLELTAYADNAGGLGNNAPRGWGVDVLFNEGSPAQLDGDQTDLLIYHTSAGLGGGGSVSEDVVIQPSGPDNGEVRATNTVDGSVIVVVSYIANTDIIVVDDDGAVSDTDTLTLRGTNPDTVQTSGNETFQVDFDAAGDVANPFVTVTDTTSGLILYRLRSFTDPLGATGPIATVNFDMLAGNDTLRFRTPIAAAFTSGVDQVNVLGGLGDDTAIVDVNARDLWTGRFFFDGGAGADGLTASGTPTAGPLVSSTYTPGPIPGDGRLVLNDGANQIIDFVSLAPVLDLIPAATLIVNANNADNAINYNFGSTNGVTTAVVSIDDQETITFASKTNLVINALAGSDTINLNNPTTPTGLTGITVNGGDPTGSDTVIVNGTVGADLVTISGLTANGATVTGAQPVPVTVTTSEQLVYSGQGGGDSLTYVSFGTESTLTPGAAPDAGSITSHILLGGPALLPVAYQGLGAAGSVTMAVTALDVVGTDNDDQFNVDAAGTIQIVKPVSLIPVTVPINTPGVAFLRLMGRDGDDIFNVPGNHPFPFGINVQGGNPSASDVLNFTSSGGNVTVDFAASTVTETGFASVSFSGVETLNVNAGGADLTVLGTANDDHFVVTPDETVATTRLVFNNTTVNANALDEFFVDGVSGDDTLTVNATATGNTVDVTGTFVDITIPNRQRIDYLNIDDLRVIGSSGPDTFNVTSSLTTSMFIDGGDPIGVLPGDVLNIVGGGAITFFPGPESDEGGFQDGINQPISFDHIETTSLAGGGPLVINGTTGNDVITVIARDASTHAGADGVQDFTVSVNGGPEVLFIDTPAININALAGDDVITVRTPAPNDAVWAVAVLIDGGEFLPSASGEQDEVRIETPYIGAESTVYIPTGLYSGVVILADLASLVQMTDVAQASYDGFQDGDDLTVAVPNAVITPGSDPGSGVIHPTDLVGNPLLDLSYRNVTGPVAVSGLTAVIQGTDENDIITVDAAGIVTVTNELGFNNTIDASLFDNLVINALGGDDVINIAANAPFLTIDVLGGDNGTATDELNFNAVAAAGLVTLDYDAETVTQTGGPVVSFDGIELVNIDAAGNSVDINGTPDDDAFIVRPNDATGALVELAGNNTKVQVNNTLDLEIDGDNGAGLENSLTIIATAGNDAITLDANQIAIAGRLPIQYSDIQALRVEGRAGADTLTVNVSLGFPTNGGGNPIPITFDGEDGLDTLVISGTPTVAVDEVIYGPGPLANAGRVRYEDAANANLMTIDFVNLEPVVDLVVAATLTVNGTNANNAINYTQGTVAANGLVSVDGFETIEFSNKTTLVLNGLAGSDTINLNNPSTPTALTGITVNGGDPTANTDTVIVNGTAAVDAIVVDLLTADGARVVGAQPVPVTIATAEHLTIDGQGGNDTLTYTTPVGGAEVTFTPGATPDAGSITATTFIANPLLPVSFENLDVNGSLTFANVGGGRTDGLDIIGTDNDDQFDVDSAGVVQIVKPTFLIDVTLPINTPGVTFLRLIGRAGDDIFNIPGDHPIDTGISVQGGDPSASDVLNFTAAAPAPALDVTVDLGAQTVGQDTFADVTYTGIEILNVDASGQALEVLGTDDDDDLTITVLSATSGQIEIGYAVQQNGQVDQAVGVPLINYSDLAAPGLITAVTPANALTVDLGLGEDTLVVVGNALSQTFHVNANTIAAPAGFTIPGLAANTLVVDDLNDATNDGAITWLGSESLSVFGLEGNDTFNVNAGPNPVFIDGGDPIGVAPGDTLVPFGAIGLVFEGPEVDEGGFITGPGGVISFDHIESLVVAPNGPCPFLILGTNADDDITVLARDQSYIIPPAVVPPGLDGIQDFTVTINAGPEVLFIDEPDLFIDALAGDDDIVIRAPAPNDADWAVEVRVAGGPPATGAPNEGDRLVVETPGVDLVEFRPTGPETGRIVINENGVPDFQDLTGDSVIIFGPFVFICDDPVGPPIEFIYNSSPGGMELVEYDGLDNEADPPPAGPAGDIVDNADDVITIFGTAGNDTTTVTPTGTVGVGLGEGSFISNLSPIFNFVSFQDLNVNGGGGFDHVIYNGTEGPDALTASGTNGIVLGDTTVTLDAAIEKLTVYTFGGDDNINIDIQVGTIAKTVDAGAGNDTIDLAGSDDADIFGGIGNDIIVGTPAADNIFGGPGNDDITAGGGIDHVYGGTGNDRLIGGADADFVYGEEGNDIFGDFLVGGVPNGVSDDGGADHFDGGLGSDIFVWEPGDGNDTIEGGSDESDRIIFQGSAVANTFIFNAGNGNVGGTRLEFLFGAVDLDVAGVEEFDLNTLAGSDTVTVRDLTQTDIRFIDIDLLTAAGDADTVIVDGRAVSDQVDINTLAPANPAIVAITGLAYDIRITGLTAVAGAGGDVLTFNGNAGNDTVVSNDALNTLYAPEDVIINGGDGDDFISGFGTLNGDAGNDSLLGGAFVNLINGGTGDDLIRGGGGGDALNGDAGEDTFLADFDNVLDTYNGGADFDTILIQATSGNDRIDVIQDNPTQIRFDVRGLGVLLGNGVVDGGLEDQVDALAELGGNQTVEEVEIQAGSGDDIIRVAHADSLVAAGDPLDMLRFTVDGGLPGASDRLTVTDLGIGDTTVQRIGGIAGDGSFTMYAFTGGVIGAPIIALPPVVYTGVEFASLNPIGPITGGTGQIAPFGRLFVFKHDPYEANNTLHEATFLGANETTNVDPTIDPGTDPVGGPGFGLPGDEDWYRIVAEHNGTLDIQVYFDQYAGNGVRAGLPSEGNLEIAVYDVDGLIGAAPLPGAIAGVGTFGTNDTNDDERIRIPVVAGQTYYLRVVGAPFPAGDLENASAAINIYNISVVNTPAAVPFDLELDDIIGVAEVDGVPATTATTFSASPIDASFTLSTVNGFYNGKDIVFTDGPLVGLRGRVTTYTGATQTFAFAPGTFPDFTTLVGFTGSNFQIESADTGRSQFDNITRDTTPTIFLRVPDVINDAGVAALDDLPYNGSAPGNPPDQFIPIRHISNLDLDVPFAAFPNGAGFRVPIFVTEHGTSDQGLPIPPDEILAGYAQPVDPVNRPGLFSFTFGSTGSFLSALPVNPGTSETTSFFISARVEIIDPAQNINPVAPQGPDNQEQAQGYGAFAQSLEIVVDTQEPPVFFGLPNDPDDGLLPDSDTGVTPTNPDTLTDLITSDTTPGFFGQAEADAVVRLFIDAPQLGFPTGNGIFEPAIDFQIGFDVAEPFDGTNQYPNGFWQIDSITVDLNAAPFDPVDGLRRIFLTAEDVAGNINDAPFQLVTDVIEIFIDTQGPQITDVEINEEGNPYDLFDPKPSNDGPTPLVNSIVLSVRDLPLRVPPGFLFPAIKEDIAENPGHYLVTGDYNGIIPILFVDVINDLVPNPAPEPGDDPFLATATIEIFFRTEGPDGQFDTSDDIGRALPDDRFTLFVNEDGILDLAGNRLDGESNADEPHDQGAFPPILGVDGVPSGDGLPGGDFVARFTVDSRPELALFAGGSVWVDANGNNLFDPDNEDFTNRDFSFVFGYTSDEIFAGQFASNDDNPVTPEDETVSDGFDKVGAYGRVGTSTFRWVIDTDNDGVPDIEVLDPSNINGQPVAGNFGPFSGDEVGVFTGSVWHFDTNHDFDVDTTIPWASPGHPIVGDFDGDGFDDLATWVDDFFTFDLSSIGPAGPVAALNNPGLGTGVNGIVAGEVPERRFRFGFIGVGERPVAADMNQDRIEDIGLWVPARDGVSPNEEAEWYFLVSGITPNNTEPSGAGQPDIGDPIGPTIAGTGDPTPGNNGVDGYLVSASGFYKVPSSLDDPDYLDGRIVVDPLFPGTNIVRFDPTPFGNDLYMQFGDQFALPLVGNFDPPVGTSGNGNTATNPGDPLDVNNDGFISPIDALLVINHMNANNGTTGVPLTGFISAPFMDVNHDRFVSPIDALLVINHLNSLDDIGVGEGEGEGEAADSFFEDLGAGDDGSEDALLSVLASDLADQTKKRK
jgi:hypothetical protein